MKVKLKRMEEIARSTREGCYTIDMYGDVFKVYSISNDYYAVEYGKFIGWLLYKEHCVEV